MSDCLVTTLKGVVDDPSLPHLGDIELGIVEGDKKGAVKVSSTTGGKIIAIGGNIVDSSGNSLGTEAPIPATNKDTTVLFDNKVTKVIIRCGYGVTTVCNADAYSYRWLRDLGAMKYHRGLTRVSFGGVEYGFVTDISVAEALKIWPSAIAFCYSMPTETVDLSCFSGSSTEWYVLLFAKLSGALADMGNAISEIILTGCTDEGVTDKDLAKVSSRMLMLTGPSFSLTWESERAADLCPFALSSVRLGNYVDAMLINMAKGTKKDAPYTTISVIGTRTSASDDAVTTLQSKGWTITVTPES